MDLYTLYPVAASLADHTSLNDDRGTGKKMTHINTIYTQTTRMNRLNEEK